MKEEVSSEWKEGEPFNITCVRIDRDNDPGALSEYAEWERTDRLNHKEGGGKKKQQITLPVSA